MAVHKRRYILNRGRDGRCQPMLGYTYTERVAGSIGWHEAAERGGRQRHTITLGRGWGQGIKD